MSYLTFNDIPLTTASTVKRNKRFQRAAFGDGYSQIMADGLNAEKEVWSCRTDILESTDAFTIEALLKRSADTPISWSPPDTSKSFVAQFSAGTLILGYTNISSLVLTGYTRPANYTANLVSGVLTSVTIANSVPITIALTESPKNYLLRDGWQLSYVSCNRYELAYELERIYV
jgi:phage-related protein